MYTIYRPLAAFYKCLICRDCASSCYHISKTFALLPLDGDNKPQEDSSQISLVKQPSSLVNTGSENDMLYLSKFNEVFIKCYQIFMKKSAIFLAV